MSDDSVAKKRAKRPDVRYTPELADTIIAKMCSGLSVVAICRQNGMPTRQAVQHWRSTNEDFKKRYTASIELRGCLQVERIMELMEHMERIAKDVASGKLDPERAKAMIWAKKAQIDTHKWAAAKLAPKIYGDRVALTDSDGQNLPAPVENKIQFVLNTGAQPGRPVTYNGNGAIGHDDRIRATVDVSEADGGDLRSAPDKRDRGVH